MPQELSDVFHHEWGHSWLQYNYPEYNDINDDLKEVMADEIADRIRANNGLQQINRTEFKRLYGRDGYKFYKHENWNPIPIHP